MIDLMTALHALNKQVRLEHPQLNSGGCCVYAALVAKQLSAQGVEARIVVCTSIAPYARVDIDEVRPQITDPSDSCEWNSNGVYFSHVAVEFYYDNWRYICDSDDIRLVDETSISFGTYWLLDGALTLQEAEALGADPRAWNRTFDRRQIPQLKKTVAAYFH